jgi:protocatechuate 3,4-dioxygenase beta subunit
MDNAVSSLAAGTFNGTAITGTLVGSTDAPCWPPLTTIFTFRADVTGLVTDGVNTVSLASGAAGAPPLLEGASLVVIFSNPAFPSTDVIVQDGAVTFANPPEVPTLFSPIPSFGTSQQATTTWIVADGQGKNNPGLINRILVNGTQFASPVLNGAGPGTPYWDTRTDDISAFVPTGTTSVTVAIESTNGDCLTWVAQVVAVTKAPTTTTVSSSANPSVSGQSVTFTATVTSSAGTPTGTVTFNDGPTVLGTGTLNVSGQATFPTSLFAVGTHSITATYGGDGNFDTSASTVLSQVVKLNQTIAFGPLQDRILGEPPFPVSATASSGLPVSFSIVSGPATIAGSTVTLTGAGIVTVRASQAGNATYNPAPSVEQSFTVAAGGSITGQVTDGVSGIVGATVFGSPDFPGGTFRSTTTDPGGFYTLAGFTVGSYWVSAQAENFVTQWYSGQLTQQSAAHVVVSNGQATGGINFQLATGAGSISGTVTDSHGNPLQNVSVNISLFSGGYVLTVNTNAAGFYSTGRRLAPGTYIAQVFSNGFAPQFYSNKPDVTTADPVPVTTGADTTVNFSMLPGGTITGTIRRASDHSPVGGAVVTVYNANNAWVAGNLVTDANGVYTAPGLATGSYKVQASASGLASLYYVSATTANAATLVPVTAGLTTSGIDITLPAGGGIVGTVTSFAVPLGGVEVDAFDSASNQFVASTLTAPNGSYTFNRSLGPGAYKVRARAFGYATQFSNGVQTFNAAAGVAVAANADTTVNFSLTPGFSLRGTVQDAGTNLPLQNASLTVFDASNQFVEGSFFTAADGTYDTQGRLKGGVSYKVQAQAAGHAQQAWNGQRTINTAQPVPVGASDVSGIDFSLQPGGGVKGTVRNFGGIPIQGIVIEVFDAAPPNAFITGGFVTQADGTFDTGHTLAGSYKIRARDPSLGFVTTFYNGLSDGRGLDFFSATPVTAVPGSDVTNVDISMPFGGTISGRIRVQGSGSPGTPIANASVFVSRFSANNFSGTFSTRTDVNGNFFFGGLRKGEWVVRAEAPGFITAYHSGVPDSPAADNGSAMPIAIDLQDPINHGNVTMGGVSLAQGGGSISGQVTRSDGGPVPQGTQIQALVGAGGFLSRANFVTSANTDALGNFTISGLAPGRYLIQAIGNQFPNGTAMGWYPTAATSPASAIPVTVTTGVTTLGVNFTVLGFTGGTTPRTISGAVRDTNGDPIRFGNVQAIEPFLQFGIRGISINGDGSYTIPNLPPGKWLVRAQTETTFEMRLFPNEVVVPAGALVDVTAGDQTGINFTLPATAGTIQGLVTTPSDPNNPGSPLVPVPGVQVSARNFFDNNVVSFVTRQDGTYLIRGLPPGDYKIRITPVPGLAPRHYTATATPTNGQVFDDGSFVHVGPGQNVTGIDVVLAPATGKITGTVLTQGTLAPVIGGAVTVRETTTGATVVIAVTRADGSFALDSLAPGSYKLRVTAPGYAVQYSFGKDTQDAADAIVVAAGSTLSNANFVLSPVFGAFSGQAFETDGSPLANVGIVVFDAAAFSFNAQHGLISAVTGANGFVAGSNSVTDSQGRFIVDRLKPGDYIAQARGLGYARTFFGQTPSPDAATFFPITVPPDPNAPPVNFNMSRSADIAGTIDYLGAQTGALRISLFCDSGLTQQVYADLVIPTPNFASGQAYTFMRPAPDTRGLLPSNPTCSTTGSYFLSAFVDANGNGVQDATEPQAVLAGATPTAIVVAEGATVSSVNLALAENLAAGGTTSFALGAPLDIVVPPAGATGSLTAVQINENGAGALSTAGRIQVSLDPPFTFATTPNVSTGASWGLTVTTPQLENGNRTFSFALGGHSRGGGASIIVSGMIISAPAGSVPDSSPPIPVAVNIGSSAPMGLTPQQISNVARLIPPPPSPVFIRISIDSNTAGVGVTRTVVIEGFNLDRLDFTNPDLSLRDSISFGDPNIIVVGTPVVSADGTRLTVTVQVAPGATIGDYVVVIINNPGGQPIVATLANGGRFTVDPLPIVTGAGTGEAHTGPVFADLKKQTAYIVGDFFGAPTTSPPNIAIQFSGTGITVDPTSVVFQSPTLLSVEVDVALGADADPLRSVMVTNPDLGSTTSVAVLAVAPHPPDAPTGLPASKTSGTSTPPPAPSISAISPSAARTGASVTITGTGFGTTTTTTVTFTAANNTKATVTPASATSGSLSVVIPASAVDGPVTVTVGSTPSSNSANFTVTNPRPSTLSPASAFQGKTVTLDLTGAKFQSLTTVALSPATGATMGTLAFLDATHIQVPVTLAANAPIGLRDVVVTNPDGGTAALSKAFEVKLQSATTMTLVLKNLDGTPIDASTWLPSVGGVQLTLDATGKCTGKTVTPASVIVEAQVSGVTLPASLTFSITPSAIRGTATNEDCEIDPVSLAVIPVTSPATNDFTIGALGSAPILTAPLSVTVNVVNGVAQAQLASWDWGGKVRIDVKDDQTTPTVAGSLSLPLDSDGDDLPDVYENNLVAGVDNTDANGVNVFDSTKRDQNANGVADRDDKFAKDGLTNFEKYRGVYFRGPLPGAVLAPMGTFVRLGGGKRNLFARGRGFSTDPAIKNQPGTCGVDNAGNPVAQDAAFLAAFPCPTFQVGDAFRAIGVQVLDTAASFSASTTFPTKSYVDPTKAALDMATVTYDAANCSGGQACDHSGKTGIRQWQFPTLGFSSFGTSSAYGDARVFVRAMKAYFIDRPYLHQENVLGTYLPKANSGGVPMLAPITIVCDSVSAGSDNGVADTGECKDASGNLGGDVFKPGVFNLDVTAMDVNNDGCVELPFVGDPTTLTRCDPKAPSASGVQATFQQVVRSIITHELGHASGINTHTADSTDLMYQYSINWTRDGHFSPTAASLIQVHNKGLQ